MLSDRTRWPKPKSNTSACCAVCGESGGAVEMHGKDSVGELRRENATRQLPHPVWSHWSKGNRLLVPHFARAK